MDRMILIYIVQLAAHGDMYKFKPAIMNIKVNKVCKIA